MKKQNELDVIVPIILDANHASEESIVNLLLSQRRLYGFNKFILVAPTARWRAKNFPEQSVWEDLAHKFLRIKNQVKPRGISLGWLVGITLKSGGDKKFSPMVKGDGSQTPFSSCPLDQNFKNQFAKNVAEFAKIAKPEFIHFEDDFSIFASTFSDGCFCPCHLEELKKLTGKAYSREQLVEIFIKNTPDSYDLKEKFKKISKDSLVEFARAVRRKVDECSPEIPLGLWQSGGLIKDGNATEEIALALAGENHTPSVRLAGCFYCGGDSLTIPKALFEGLYHKQSFSTAINCYYEADTFPHTRFFSPAKQLKSMLAISLSYGSVGAIYHSCGHLDYPDEEQVYGRTYRLERKRFNEIYSIIKDCELDGVSLNFDAFWNTELNVPSPLWLNCLSRFGVPYTTKESKVKFLDKVGAETLSHDQIVKALSGGLILDGESAKILCERGYSKYLGVTLGDDITLNSSLGYDLFAHEVIRDEFVEDGKGKLMHPAHFFAPSGMGKNLAITISDKDVEIISDIYTGFDEYVCPAAARFVNALGGRVVVFGITTHKNLSQALLNYRRQGLLGRLIRWCGGDYPLVKNNANVFMVFNRPKDDNADFKAILTLTLLAEEKLKEFSLSLPKNLSGYKIKLLKSNGKWAYCSAVQTDDGVTIKKTIDYLEPTYLLITNEKL